MFSRSPFRAFFASFAGIRFFSTQNYGLLIEGLSPLDGRIQSHDLQWLASSATSDACIRQSVIMVISAVKGDAGI